MAEDRGDYNLWTVTTDYLCPNCADPSQNCKYIQTIGTNKKEDQSEEPVITVRCDACEFIWQAEGENFGAGVYA